MVIRASRTAPSFRAERLGRSRALRWLLVFGFTAIACPRPGPRPPNESEPSPVTPGDLASLALEPERLISMVDESHGVAVARVLGCEREHELRAFRRVCGPSIVDELSPLLEGLAEQIRNALIYRDEPGILCTPEGSATECIVMPHGECQAKYHLFFSGRNLVAIVERDDWQSQAEYLAAVDDRIEALLANPGCSF